MKLLLPLALAATLIGLPAAAHDHAAFSYADFESSVPHIDLDECPAGMAEGDVFCRISMNNDALHIFVFEAEGDQHLVAVHSFFEDEFQILFSD
jgi:hypothetical protein